MSTIILKLGSVILSIFLSVMTFFTGIGAKQPAISEDGTKNIPYGDGVCEVFDLYIPEGIDKDNANLALLIHGGAWMSGSQAFFTGNVKDFTDEGFVVANMDHQKIFDGATAEDMLQDIDACINKAIELTAAQGITLKKMIVMGHSSGAHLSLLYAYSRTDECPLDIAFVIDASGPVDIWEPGGNGNEMLASNSWLACCGLTGQPCIQATADLLRDEINAINPITYIDANTPPTIIVHGDNDTIVPIDGSIKLDAALTAAGVAHEFIVFEGTDHTYFAGNLEKGRAETAEAFYAYMDAYL